LLEVAMLGGFLLALIFAFLTAAAWFTITVRRLRELDASANLLTGNLGALRSQE
jgi:uncharacterized membrane protein YhaH (DUF805 family)